MELESSPNHIVFAGLSGIPEEPVASIQRVINLGKALVLKNWKVTYLNRLPLKHGENCKDDFFPGMDSVSIADALKYRKSNDHKIGRLFWKVIAFPAEFIRLIAIHRKKKIDILFIYSQYFGLVLFYTAIARLLSCKTILSYVEFRSGISSRNGIFIRMNDFLFDRFAFRLTNGVNPISHRIEQHVATLSPGKPQFRIPALCDFSLFYNHENKQGYEQDYFLFCGTAGYIPVIRKTIQAFLALENRDGFNLQLVISGDPWQLENVRKEFTGTSAIRMVSCIPYQDLVSLYTHAVALVIPLRDTIQDNFRFPHKISEYTASKRPIITTNIGEITWYFRDKENAILCRDTSIEALTEAMEWTVQHKSELNKIGDNGYRTGMDNFSHTRYQDSLHNFFLKIIAG